MKRVKTPSSQPVISEGPHACGVGHANDAVIQRRIFVRMDRKEVGRQVIDMGMKCDFRLSRIALEVDQGSETSCCDRQSGCQSRQARRAVDGAEHRSRNG